MYAVSNAFKTAMESNIKSLAVRIKYKDDSEKTVTLTGDNSIISVKISSECELGSSAVRKAEVSLLKINLPDSFYSLDINEYFTIEYGTKTAEAQPEAIPPLPEVWEYVYIGAFKIIDWNEKEDDQTLNIVAYDRMYDTMVNYVDKLPDASFWTSETTLSQYISNVLGKCSITLGNTDFVHNGLKITSERFASKNDKGGYVSNIFGYTVRDLINNICQISGTVAIISPYNNSEDRLYFKKLDVNTIKYTLSSTDTLISFKKYDEYGKIGKVVFAREPQQDYFPKIHADLTNEEEITEWKVDNNQLVDYQPIIDPKNPTQNPPLDKRSEYIVPTFNAVCGADAPPHSGAIFYYPFESQTIGYGWFEIGDRIRLGSIDTFVLAYSVTFDGGITENISARKTNKTDSKVKMVSNQAQNQTQLVVDKQNQIIKSYVQQTKDNSDKITQLQVTNNNVKITVSQTGGDNLIKNSSMWNNFVDSNSILQAKEWTRSNTGSLSISYIGKARCDSGFQFTLDGETVTQSIVVEPHQPYSLYYRVKKDSGQAYIKFYDDIGFIRSETFTGVALKDYKSYESINFSPSISPMFIEISAVINSNTSITDLMLVKGTVSKSWSLASGEISNDNVIIDNSGIVVSGQGSFSTIISPTEFVGKQNGQVIFSLNNQTTVVNKLKAQYQIDMPPLKLISTGNAWAIVRSD
jgi:hypothetical protein